MASNPLFFKKIIIFSHFFLFYRNFVLNLPSENNIVNLYYSLFKNLKYEQD